MGSSAHDLLILDMIVALPSSSVTGGGYWEKDSTILVSLGMLQA